ncbi:MAG: TIGR02757 family protein [Deltaproteobacteria bacterium]|nr:MAG: TIGR02757 family protein [Deltaproteobacteria bacterium]
MPSSKPLSNQHPQYFHNRHHQAAFEKVRELASSITLQPITSDPVYFVHQYTNHQDQEVVGLISALMAFGQVKSIHAALRRIFEVMGTSPVRYLKSFDEAKGIKLKTIQHRWVRGDDLILLMKTLSKILKEYGSLKNLFLEGYREIEDVSIAMGLFSKKFLEMSGQKSWSRGFRHFFPSPEGGSPCKRLCMYLRWMVRPRDGVDLGLWTEIKPAALIVPLDTHIYQFAKKYRLSRHKNPNWKASLEITQFLKTIDSEDPVRYDYAICHYGMEVGW